MTGFRFAYGGAQEYYGVTPDLCTLGKIVGGGFHLPPSPAAPTSWRISTGMTMADEDFIFQVGTLLGNPVASVAGLATLDVLNGPAPTSGFSPPAAS